MAIKKADKRFLNQVFRSVLILYLLLGTVTSGWALVSNQSAVLSSDLNGDGVAGIGDTITFSCRSTTADTSQYPFVNLSQFGNPYFPLPNIAGNFYSAFLTISPGNVENNTAQSFQFSDEDGVRIGGSLLIDNRRPFSQYGPTVTGGTGTSGYFKIGDSIQVDITMNSSLDSDVPRANLTNIGLGASHIFSRVGGPDSSPVYQLSLTFPNNREGTATALTVSATDDAGNSRQWDLSVNYDTVEPEIQSVTAVNMTTGKTWVTSGDTIRIQAVIDKYDYDKVKVFHPILFPSGITMIRTAGAPGSEATFQYDYYLADVPDVQSNFITFEVRATDDVGNESSPRNSNPLALDNMPPEFSLPFGVDVVEKGGIKGDNIAIIGDQLHFVGNLSSIMNDVTITVDLSGIGGVANQIIPFNNSATTTFELWYDIHQYTSENTTPRAFTVTAKDIAGNQISQVILPIIYVDNTPPILTAGLAQNISRPGQTVRYGDQLAIQANLSGIDGGSIWTNFERIGGTASSTLSPYSGTVYRLDHTVGDPTFGNAYDQTVSFTIYAADDAGNTVYTVANSIKIDNEIPKIRGSRYTSSPAISATHPYVRIGDRINFFVQLASSSASVHDLETVKISLTEFGQTSAVDMVYDGVGSYTFSIDVPEGDLNDDHYFAYRAEDNAGNAASGNIYVHIDNKKPDVGPMAINYMTDLNKSGIVNIGDRLEIIVPVTEPDSGTCTIDLSYVGGPSAYIMNYDPVLLRYYLVHDCAEAAMESTSYVFRANVSDKAGNSLNSLSGTFEVDCRPPVLMYASATVQELKGKTGVVNIGDKVTIVAKADLTRVDGGSPVVNLTALGGNSAQALYDDGAHNDNLANDGIYGYTHTVVAGDTDGDNMAFTVELTDNAGNRALASTEALFVDNKPLTVGTCTIAQVFDNNGNTIVDLDGMYTTYPSVATDVVRLEVDISGNPGDMGTMTVDLTKLGINDTARQVPYVSTAGGWRASADYMPIVGTTDDEEIDFTVKLTDVNGNELIRTTTTKVRVDNRPPKLEIYPISFVVDQGRLGEANLNDVIQVRVKVTNNNSILPMIDFTNLYLQNGLTPPGPTLFPPPTLGEYVYEWTVPEGLGTVASLTILAYDASGNMKYGHTNEIRFLSKTPTFAPFPQTRADLSRDDVPVNLENQIANPPQGVLFDEVTLTVVMSSLYNVSNSPSAKVLADIRSIVNSPSDDSAADYFDGNMKTYWQELDYQTTSSGAGNYVYRKTIQVAAGGVDVDVASFGVRVLHPDVKSIVLATATINCDPANTFGIDTQPPEIVNNIVFSVLDENDDNIASNVINIDDLLYVKAEINKFEDTGSATAVLLRNSAPDVVIHKAPLYQIPGTKIWEAMFRVATTTLTGWPALDNANTKVRIIASDDADNFTQREKVATFTIDNVPPEITAYKLRIVENNNNIGVGNVGDGFKTIEGDLIGPDQIVASITANGANFTTTGKAYVDFSPINGTSTFYLDNPGSDPLTVYSNPFSLATNTFDLATHTFNLFVVDSGGNRAFKQVELTIDTTRPRLETASYDGRVLTLNFSEPIVPAIFQARLDRVRLGSKMDHATIQIPRYAVSLNSTYDLVAEDYNSSMINIQLSSGTKAIIADWGLTNLYVSIASKDGSSGEANPGDTNGYIALDVSGNWLQPMPRTPATSSVTITNTYTTRPHLVTGTYHGNDPAKRDRLYLQFDKDMDPNTINETTLKNLAIWRNRGNPLDSFTNRYRFAVAASDTIIINNPNSPITEVELLLSQQAQDWIALNYTRTATQFHLQINGNKDIPVIGAAISPLIRDFEGNQVVPIPYTTATPATLIPLNTQFSIQNASLDFSGAQPRIKIGFDNTARVRMYTDPYLNSQTQISQSRNLPVDLSRVYLYAKSDLTGGSLPLNKNMVDYTAFKAINIEYASNTATIPLTAEALKTMLSWGTSQFYIACSESAFVDLWGNGSIRYPVQGNEAINIPISPPIVPGSYPSPKIWSVAVTPAKEDNTLGYNQMLFKGQPLGNFYYEVSFNTATVSADVYIPIDRTQTPELQLKSQVDNEVKDSAQFVGWLDHDQGGIIRTVARFTNNSDLTATQDSQREPMYVQVNNVLDVFGGQLGAMVPEDKLASRAYDLSQKNSHPNGFAGASATMALDNVLPVPVSIIPTGTIGITPAGGAVFQVTFSEPMNQEVGSSYRPQLRLGKDSTTAMNFSFARWVDAYTAEFTNSANFDANTAQGTFEYYVSGGYDIAGNRGGNEVKPGDQLQIRSKGPNISTYRVITYQSTTAKADQTNGTVDNQPFSPLVPPGVATISISFEIAPTASALWLHIGDTASPEILPIKMIDSNTGIASWPGTIQGSIPVLSGVPKTYVMRVYDDAGNEANKQGSIILDTNPPAVSSWQFSNIRTYNGKAYFSPLVSSFAKIDVFGPKPIDAARMRLYKPASPTGDAATMDVYPMTAITNGFTISFNGNDTNTPQGRLNGEYQVNAVDLAGNIGIPMGTGSVATATLVVDIMPPVVAAIETFRDINGVIVPATRFNPNVAGAKLRVEVASSDIVSDGVTNLADALIKITSGSTLVREIQLTGAASPFVAEWDGKDSNNQPVVDGTYQISVIDLAGNQATDVTSEIYVVNSIFKVTSVNQIDKTHLRVTFSHAVSTDALATMFELRKKGEASGQTAVSIAIDDTQVTLGFAQEFEDKITYVVTASTAIASIDGAQIATGYNSAEFIADTIGPKLVELVTYDGLTSQRQFNLTFDDASELDAASAVLLTNYKFTLGTTTIDIDSVKLRADLKSVTVTTRNHDLSDTNFYTIEATGVKDALGNEGTSFFSFYGRDITPPELTITAFSNPANEFDFSIAVKANEDLTSPPTAVITQSGGTAVSQVLNAGPQPRLFIGGVHLDVNYPGVATVKVTGTDTSNNSGTANMSFSTAFVNASVRASLQSPDSNFTAVFEPGTLKQNSLVAIMPEQLSRVEAGENRGARIVPSVMAELTSAQVNSIRASSLVEGQSAEELVPVGNAYSMTIAAGRLAGNVRATFKLSAEQLEAGTGLYRSDVSLGWKPVAYSLKDGEIEFYASEPGTFAIMKDVLAPRASLLTKIENDKPFREPRPSFIWNIEELGSGLNVNQGSVVMNNRSYPVMFDASGKVVRFVPTEDLVGGEYEMTLRLSDNAGNQLQTAALRFQVLPPLVIYEVNQYPNPARNRVNLRISTNRPDVDWGEIEVKIYDVAGHKVADSSSLSIRTGTNGLLQIQDVMWDLRAKGGKQVANGVYFAKITVRDPDNWNKKAKYTHKIAVLR